MINLKRTIIKEITVKFQQAWAKPCMSEASSEGKKKKNRLYRKDEETE